MTSELKHSIMITCPACSSKGQIKIEKNLVERNERGVTAINVASDLICKHSFVAYIDRNLIVRDSFVCDFEVKLPDIKIKTDFLDDKRFDLDLDIIKLNLTPSLLIKIIVGIVAGKKILIISDNEHINQYFKQFLKIVLVDTFKSSIDFIPKVEYKKNKKSYQDYIVLQDHQVLRDKTNFLNKKKSKIENIITQNFYNSYDQESSFIILKNEFQKAFILAKDIIELNNLLTDELDLSKKRMIDFLNEKYNVKISIDYLQFLEEIIFNYFNVQLKKPSNSADFLGFI